MTSPQAPASARPADPAAGVPAPGATAPAPEAAPAASRPPDPAARVVDVDSVLRESQVEAVLAQLDHDLVALAPVKTRLREIAALLVVERLRRQVGLAAEAPSLHMSFTGHPGTGKTTVALRMAEILHRLGYLERGHLVAVTRDDLVGQYVGHTAPRTREVISRALGGVLFIDEAYHLHRRDNERDYGQEAIEILLQAMESERSNLVVILAGYRDRMDDFFRSNPGMFSRIAHHIDFPDYTVDELLEIARLMLRRQQYELTDDALDAFRAYIERRIRQPHFANARSIRNAIDRARLRQAGRIFARGGLLTRDDLVRIEAEDILRSRVFRVDEPDGQPSAGSPTA